MSEERWSVPDTWSWAPVGDIADVVGGGTPPAKDPDNFCSDGIAWLTPADLTGYDAVYISKGARDLTEQGLAKSSAKLLPAGAVLYSSRAPIGYCAIAANEISTNQGFKSLVLSDDVSPDFIRLYLLASKDYAESKASGTTFKEVSGARVKQFPIPLPPLAEQRRIVQKLDQLSARTRAAKDHLAHVQTLATRAKQAILAAAFSDSFETIELGELAEEVRYGTSKKCGYNLGSTPVLRIPNVAKGKIDSSDLKSADFDTKEINKLSLQAGDLLIIRSNGSVDLVGRSALVEDQHAGYLFAGYLIRVRLDLARVRPEYVQQVLASDAARQFIERLAKSTSGVNNINSAQIASIPVPLPTLEEQSEIVYRIEAAFTRIDRMVAEASSAAELLDRLEAQLLTKAFRGELVPQDPADEPASVLLTRIREARASAPKPKRRAKPANKEANDAFKRSVLATYIADMQCDHATFGRVKFQKLLHLCEAHLEIQEVAGNYYRDAAGPFDTQMMRSVHSQIKKSGWITMTKREGGKGWTYRRGDKIEGYKTYFGNYYGDRKEAIDDLLALIGPMNTEQAEIVSTAFAAWNDLLLEGKAPSDDEIVDLILNDWTESKKAISANRWHRALDWMREKGLTPRGLGEHTKKKR